MRTAFKYFKEKPLYLLLVAALLAIVLDLLEVGPVWILASASLGMIPMAGLIGEATESLAERAGPRLGGLLNATFGNAAELIITLVAIREGLLELVKASITGSILGNLLVVMGLSMLAGGLRHGVLTFDRKKASSDSILLVLAVITMAVPSLFVQTSNGASEAAIEWLSLGVATLMILVYVLGLVYSLKGRGAGLLRPAAEPAMHDKRMSPRASVGLLVAATLGVVWLSEILVRQVEPVVSGLGVSEFFLGIILIPLIGNVAEHMVAVTVALKNQMNLSVEISVGSSLQIALFVAPVLVFASLAMGNPLTLVFNSFELIALIGGVLIAALVASDGEANWLEGVELLVVYFVLALAFFLLPV